MKGIKEEEITWTAIDNNLRVGVVEGKGVIIEHEERRIFLDKKKAKKLKLKMLDVFEDGAFESYETDRNNCRVIISKKVKHNKKGRSQEGG